MAREALTTAGPNPRGQASTCRRARGGRAYNRLRAIAAGAAVSFATTTTMLTPARPDASPRREPGPAQHRVPVARLSPDAVGVKSRARPVMPSSSSSLPRLTRAALSRKCLAGLVSRESLQFREHLSQHGVHVIRADVADVLVEE